MVMVDGNDNCEAIQKPVIGHKKPALSSHMRANQSSHSSKASDHPSQPRPGLTPPSMSHTGGPNGEQWMDRTPCGSATPSPHVDEAYETPPCVRWGIDFQYLINDGTGVEVFREYLENEGIKVMLDFWLACEGLKSGDWKMEQIPKLTKTIYRMTTNNNIIVLSQEVRDELRQKNLSKPPSKTEEGIAVDPNDPRFDTHVFDAAQREVEKELKGAIYQNFTRSKVYIEYCQVNACSHLGAIGGYDLKTSLKDDSSAACERPLCQMESSLDDYNRDISQNNPIYDHVLPTVHEDSELQTTNTSSAVRPAANVNTRSHPQNKLQSSSEDNCHNLMSSGSSEVLRRGINKIMSQKSSNSSARIMTEAHPLSPNPSGRIHPGHQSYLRSKAMANPPNPYHVKYSTVLPTSAQDSEIQSISSHSTNDSMSCVSGSDGNNNSGVRTRKQMKHNARINSNPSQMRINAFAMPMRTPRPPPNANDASHPDRFAEMLIERLEKLRQQQETEEMTGKKLAECLKMADPNSDSRPGVPPRPPSANPSVVSSTSRLREYIKENPVFESCLPEEEESNQAILDMHCAQVFKTPNETPTDSIGRCISPPKHMNYRLYDQRMTPPVSQHVSSGFAAPEPSVRVTVKYSNEQIPYLITVRAHQITLRKFKQLIKPGNWQFYFKRKCDEKEMMDIAIGYVMEKITDDNKVLPLIDGKIFAELQEMSGQ